MRIENAQRFVANPGRRLSFALIRCHLTYLFLRGWALVRVVGLGERLDARLVAVLPSGRDKRRGRLSELRVMWAGEVVPIDDAMTLHPGWHLLGRPIVRMIVRHRSGSCCGYAVVMALHVLERETVREREKKRELLPNAPGS